MRQAKEFLPSANVLVRTTGAQAGAVQLRIIPKGLTPAMLNRDVDIAVSLELERLSLGGGVTFAALRTVQDEWFKRGRDKGLRFDLEVSISLPETRVERASDSL